MTNTISEETIAALVDAAQNIADDSTAMRQSMVSIADAMSPVLKQAGINFGSLDDDQTWTTGAYPDVWTNRIGVRKVSGEWMIGIEETQLYPERWDGSNWSGYANPFSSAAHETGMAMIESFSQATRQDIEEAVQRFPDFLLAYSKELSQRGAHFADLREKAEAMLKIVEG